jgi:hypothetical protein
MSWSLIDGYQPVAVSSWLETVDGTSALRVSLELSELKRRAGWNLDATQYPENFSTVACPVGERKHMYDVCATGIVFSDSAVRMRIVILSPYLHTLSANCCLAHTVCPKQYCIIFIFRF